MDLSAKFNVREKANKGAFLHLKNPKNGTLLYEEVNGAEDFTKPIGIYFLGKDSDKFNQIQHHKINAAISGKKSQKTSEEIEQDSNDLIASLAVGWENITVSGESKFSKDGVLALLSANKWIKEQADLFIGDRANFI